MPERVRRRPDSPRHGGQAVRTRRQRFYVPDLAVEAGRRIDLPQAEARHAVGVLRLGVGAPVELFNGHGRSASGRIAEAGRRRVTVQIERTRREPRPPDPLVRLAFAVPKGSRADWLVEKAAELGVASLTPVVFDRSVAGREMLRAAKRERWLAQCVAAAKQSGAGYLPDIDEAVPLPGALEKRAGALVLVGDPSDDAMPIAEALARRRPGQDVLVLVGPEGGLTDCERAAIRAAGGIGVRLGRSVLRVETAALALVAAVVAITQAGAPKAPPEQEK